MPRLLLLASLAASAAAHGSGVWKDPNHYISDSSLAGLRFVSEFPPHVLNLVGTDDGKTWWALSGTCSGPAMTEINIDFSPKGGPGAVTGTWAKSGGVESITFPDGNTWVLAEKPTWAIAAPDGVDDHVGIFRDPNHFVSPKSWAGLRFIAEFPPHELRMVGSDDGNVRGMWFLAGTCTGADMSAIHFDFSPKGGPADLTGKWRPAPDSSITWPDGNAWTKVGAPTAAATALLRERPAEAQNASVALRLIVGLALAAGVVLAVRLKRQREGMADGIAPL